MSFLFSKKSEIVIFIIAFLGAAYFVTTDTSFIANVIFSLCMIAYAALTIITILRGPDELHSAAVRYGLAFASGLGVPIALAFTMLMRATPNIQGAIASAVAYSPNGLSPASVGFGMGVMFALMVIIICFVLGHAFWWASKR